MTWYVLLPPALQNKASNFMDFLTTSVAWVHTAQQERAFDVGAESCH